MADREKYIEVLNKTVKTVNEDASIKISLKCVEDILDLLKEQDAIVRCKDCKYAKKIYSPSTMEKYAYKCIMSECEGTYDYHDENWFCADGERE